MIRNTFLGIALVGSVILLASCSRTINALPEAPEASNNTTSTEVTFQQPDVPDSEQKDVGDFKAEQAIDLKILEDRLSEKERPALLVLERNLDALVAHDYEAYRSGFVTQKLADALGFYYDDQFEYRFTDIESLQKNEPIPNQIHITVNGKRLDASTGTIENVKLMYAIRSDGQNDWKIYTID